MPGNSIRVFFITGFLFALLITIVAAIKSIGYYHADEQYQVIEFAGYKMGTHHANELAWEFKYRLRPAFQPALCYLILSSLQSLRIYDPFHQSLILRLISGLFSLMAASLLIKTFISRFNNHVLKKLFILMSFFLWFLPFLSVRFSSETWAGSFLIIALCLIYNLDQQERRIKKFAMIFFIAATILMRYQMLLPFISIAAWYLFVKKEKKIPVLILTGFAVSILSGLLIDKWFYGEWTLPLWNYTHMVLTGAGPDFGSDPWYFYFNAVLLKAALPIGIILIAALLFFWITSPSHLFTWITLPFFVIHIFIPHKELRFLFPIAALCPYILVRFYDKLMHIPLQTKTFTTVLNIFFLLILLFNFFLLVISIQLPATPAMAIAQTIHNNYGDKKILMIHTAWADPYNPFESVPIKFYSKKNITEVKVSDPATLPDSLLNVNPVLLFVLRKNEYDRNKEYLNAKRFRLIKYALPQRILQFTGDNWFNENDDLVLLERIHS